MIWSVIGRFSSLRMTLGLACCVWALSLSVSAAFAASVSEPPESDRSPAADVLSLPAHLTRGEGHFLFRLSLQQGDYIQGRIQGDGAFHAWLSTPNQAFWRHLNRYGETFSHFQWVAPRTGVYFLEVDADQVWQIHLSQLNRLPFDPLKPAHKRPESPRIQAAIERLKAGQSEDKVWFDLVAEGTPLVEPLPQYAELAPHQRLVTFLWRGAQHNVQFLGALGGVNNELYRLPYTRDIWFRSYQMPDDTRMSYQLAPDVPNVVGDAQVQKEAALATAQRDPYNREPWGADWDEPFDARADPFLLKSTLALERASQDTFLTPPEHSIPFMQRYHFRGTLDHQLSSLVHHIDLWQPDHLLVKAYLAAKDPLTGKDAFADKKTLSEKSHFAEAEEVSLPVVIFLNGQRYQDEIPAIRVLHNLMHEGLIPPVVAALVSYPNQDAQQDALACNPAFSDFIAQKLLPLIRQETRLRLRRRHIMLVGAGDGGLAAACAAYRYPQYFGMVLSQSGAFGWHPNHPDESEALIARFEQRLPQRPIRFYFSAGWFENDFDEGPGVRSSTQHLAQVLEHQGYPVALEMFNAGHDAYHWRATLWRGLVKLLGPLSAEVKMPRRAGAND
ncbi:alpha/beta hydrolase-fold protein [Terasakiispira papahanaumokuakeensis]|nr:alpha/beta hydrolase-fold protein [Terasakiispira papahanaumokuakeensis]